MKIVDIVPHLMQAGAPNTGWSATGESALKSGRNWLFVRVVTDEGLVGVGEGSGWPRVIRAAIEDLRHILIGQNPMDIELMWQRMRLATMGHGDTGTVGAGAITAIDMALWDIKGQALGTPVWNLLGGRVRERVRYYTHAKSVADAQAAATRGVTAFKLGGIDRIVERVAAMRAALGPDVDLMVDLHGPPWLPAADAIAIGKALEPYALMFLEDPVAPEDLEGWGRVRRAVDLPLAGGERFATKWGADRLLRAGLVDVLQPDTGRAGGLTEMKKIAAMAEAAFVSIAPHSGSLGPIAEFAAAHLMAAIPNALIMERFEPDWEGREKVLTHSLEMEAGQIIVPDRPGLGVDFVDALVAAHPSRQNTSIASGGWQDPADHATTYMQMRRRRARLGDPGG